MRRIPMKRPSAAMTVAFVALIAALSGTAAALPGKNSVKSDDIKNRQVKNADLAKNSVTSLKVKDGVLRAKDFKAGELPAGEKGDKGDKGDTGDAGTAVAYATLNSGGLIIAPKSKNITQANVDPDTVAGSYCFTGLPTFKSVMVSSQGVFDGGEQDVIASAFFTSSSVSTGDCVGQVLVRTFDVSSNALMDRAFTIWFED
jgi:hypothetical protein